MSIATELTRIQGAKADIKSAIEAKGVTVPSNALIDDYDTYIAQISTGGGSSDLRDVIERDITSITIPDGTTKIGEYVFIECEHLSSVTIPNTVTRIEADAFNSCYDLTNITIPNSVTFIGDGVFYGCTGLTSVTLGNSVESLGPMAFKASGLTSITIPSSVTLISTEVFNSCRSLSTVIVEATTPPTLGTNAFYQNASGRKIYVPYQSLAAYKAATNWSTYASDIEANPATDPRVVAKFNVTSTSSATPIMDSNATSLFSSIEIDGVVQQSVVSSYTFSTTGEHTVKYEFIDPTTIGSYAFALCDKLTSVTIPNNIEEIEDSAFTNCTALASVTIGNGLTTIGNAAFSQCTSLTNITLPSSVTTLSTYIFFYCSNLATITCNATTAPTINANTFQNIKTGGTLNVPSGSTGYDVWMGSGNYYLGKYSWTKVEQ